MTSIGREVNKILTVTYFKAYENVFGLRTDRYIGVFFCRYQGRAFTNLCSELISTGRKLSESRHTQGRRQLLLEGGGGSAPRGTSEIFSFASAPPPRAALGGGGAKGSIVNVTY